MEEQNPKFEQLQLVERIAVWAGALSAYNSGILHGEWLQADVEPEELWDGVHRVLQTSPQPNEEEFGIFDHEGFQGIHLGEFESVERVTTLARLVAEHGEAFACWYNNDPSVELDEAEEQFAEAYMGAFDNQGELSAHVEDFMCIEETMQEAYGVLPNWMAVYVKFDVEGFIRDLNYNGDVFTVERSGKLYTFWSR
jgi:antirestriction protein